MPVPTLSLGPFTYASTAANTTGTTTASFTPTINDILVVIGISEGTNTWTAPTSTGLTFTSRVTDNTASSSSTQLWTAPVTAAGARTVTMGAVTALAAWHSAVCFVVSGGTLAATPATMDTRGTGAPTATITTVGTNSLVIWSNADFAAVAPTTRTYRSSATEAFIHDKSPSNYVGYFASQPAASAGAQTCGLTAPVGQTFKLVGIEIQGTAGGATPALTHPRAMSRVPLIRASTF